MHDALIALAAAQPQIAWSRCSHMIITTLPRRLAVIAAIILGVAAPIALAETNTPAQPPTTTATPNPPSTPCPACQAARDAVTAAEAAVLAAHDTLDLANTALDDARARYNDITDPAYHSNCNLNLAYDAVVTAQRNLDAAYWDLRHAIKKLGECERTNCPPDDVSGSPPPTPAPATAPTSDPESPRPNTEPVTHTETCTVDVSGTLPHTIGSDSDQERTPAGE